MRARLKGQITRIPSGVWALGLVSLLMDVSSELIQSLLPVFLIQTLGASALAVGMIEGVANAVAAMTKLVSGALSDVFGRRKGLTVLGYALAAATKPLFALAPSIGWIFTARFIDRLGKGIRGAPRDALIGDLAPPDLRGASFGLRQSLDTVGAFLGPLGAMALMVLLAGDMRLVFWFAVIPAVLSVVVMVLGVREPAPLAGSSALAPPNFALSTLARLGARYWWVVGIGAVVTLARFSEAFLVLRVAHVGLALTWIPLVMVVMSAVFALSAYPSGLWSDRIGRWRVLAVGLVVLGLADGVLAYAQNTLTALAGVALWGLHMGLTQGLLSALVADSAPRRLRGTAFGLFHLVSGVLMLAASVLAGLMWDVFGPAAPFHVGGALSLLGVVIVGLRALCFGRVK